MLMHVCWDNRFPAFSFNLGYLLMVSVFGALWAHVEIQNTLINGRGIFLSTSVQGQAGPGFAISSLT
jgi:hypothetical protein